VSDYFNDTFGEPLITPMKNTILLSLGIFIVFFSQAQTNSPNVVASGGDYFVAGTFTNSYTIGEMAMVETFTTSGFLLTQGFQQPYEFPLAVTAAEPFQGFSAFPNPSNGQVSFQYNLASNGKVSVNVFDAIGQIVYSSSEEKLSGPQTDYLDLSAFANGLYTVRYTIQSSTGNSDFFVSRITLTK
jgi:hypothetical protein